MTPRQQAYQVYLRSQHWQKIRQLALNRDKFTCLDCGAKSNLQVHHSVYRDSPYQTKLQDVFTVCRDCHEKEHQIKRDAFGNVVSMVQMPSYLKPVYPVEPQFIQRRNQAKAKRLKIKLKKRAKYLAKMRAKARRNQWRF